MKKNGATIRISQEILSLYMRDFSWINDLDGDDGDKASSDET